SCDRDTSFYMQANIVQGSTTAAWQSPVLDCAPGQAVQVWLPGWYRTPDVPFAPGSARVDTVAAPLSVVHSSVPSTVTVTDTAPISLLDYDDLVATINALIADPANAELRDEVIAAIVTRVAQDHLFAAELAG